MDGNTAFAALDIPALQHAGTAGSELFTFATPQNAYDVLSYDLPQRLLTTVTENTDGETPLRDAALAALFDIYLDLLRFGRTLTDLVHLQMVGQQPKFDPQTSPISSYLVDPDSTAVREISDIFPQGHGAFARPQSLKNKLRMLKRNVLMRARPRQGRHDVLAHGGLIDQYLLATATRTVDVNPYLFAWPQLGKPIAEIADLADILSCEFDRQLESYASNLPAVGAKVSTAARVFIAAWLNQSWSNLDYLAHSSLGRNVGSALIGGAPKMPGRLLGRFYQQAGLTVIRCAHGGERAFYDDFHWSLSELPFCDSYITHGKGEADAIVQRHTTNRMIRVHKKPPTCIGLGSARHQAIHNRARESRRNRSAQNGKSRVMVLASSFLGEGAAHVPAIKPTDVHLADLQIWLMRELRATGHEVLFKPHPKTMIDAPDLFTGVYDELITGVFDATANDVDVYMFDYAGSAFFDALASACGVVLVDTGVRPFDANTLNELRARCEIVAAPADEKNRFRPDTIALTEAVYRATQVTECSEQFARRFFYAPTDSN